MNGLIITTAQRPDAGTARQAEEIARELGVPYIQRNKESLEIISQGSQNNILVVASKGLKLITPQGDFVFHPSMSKLRIRNMVRGEGDALAAAMDLSPGNTVLDCTLGLGADAILTAFAVKSAGRVIGLESNPLLAFIVKEGLRTYKDENQDLNEAMRRVEVICANHQEYLTKQLDASFDVVYFDPMFRRPVSRSSSMEPLRRLAIPDAVTVETINEAKRVAARRVVLKETRNSPEFARLGFHQVVGGRYSPVAYGIITKGEAIK